MFASTTRARILALGLGTSLAAAFLAGTVRAAQTPDVIVYDVGVDGSDTNDIHYYGQSSGIAAYSIATTSARTSPRRTTASRTTTAAPIRAWRR